MTQYQTQSFKIKRNICQVVHQSAMCLAIGNNQNLFRRKKQPGGGHFREIYEMSIMNI